MNVRTRRFEGIEVLEVAAISGSCIGGGAEVAAGCDLRVGSPTAAIRFPGAAFGIPVGAARLPVLVGLSHAKDLLMTWRTPAAEEAYAARSLMAEPGDKAR